jgi:hypothetical protein
MLLFVMLGCRFFNSLFLFLDLLLNELLDRFELLLLSLDCSFDLNRLDFLCLCLLHRFLGQADAKKIVG